MNFISKRKLGHISILSLALLAVAGCDTIYRTEIDIKSPILGNAACILEEASALDLELVRKDDKQVSFEYRDGMYAFNMYLYIPGGIKTYYYTLNHKPHCEDSRKKLSSMLNLIDNIQTNCGYEIEEMTISSDCKNSSRRSSIE